MMRNCSNPLMASKANSYRLPLFSTSLWKLRPGPQASWVLTGSLHSAWSWRACFGQPDGSGFLWRVFGCLGSLETQILRPRLMSSQVCHKTQTHHQTKWKSMQCEGILFGGRICLENTEAPLNHGIPMDLQKLSQIPEQPDIGLALQFLQKLGVRCEEGSQIINKPNMSPEAWGCSTSYRSHPNL